MERQMENHSIKLGNKGTSYNKKGGGYFLNDINPPII